MSVIYSIGTEEDLHHVPSDSIRDQVPLVFTLMEAKT